MHDRAFAGEPRSSPKTQKDGRLKNGNKKTPKAIETTSFRVHGADSQIRTGDLILTKHPIKNSQAILRFVIEKNATSSF